MFVYNGLVLDEHLTFEFYDICAKETIFAVRTDDDCGGESGRWIQTSRDSEFFDEMMNCMLNCSTRRESMRLRDLSILRREQNRRRFGSNIFVPVSSFRVVHETSLPCKSTELCASPLPVLW